MAVEPSENIGDGQRKKRNPAILAILDPLHRSLLNSNLQYEQANGRSSDDESVSNDSDEYFTAISAITSDSAADCDANKLVDATNVGRVKVHSNRVESNAFDGNRLAERGSQLNRFDFSKQTSQQLRHLNVLDTENRCNTNCASNGSMRRQWTKSHEQISHKFNRRARNSSENKAPLSSRIETRNRRAEYSDSSDINSDTHLVIENMRNRECEMFRKISFNNGYFDPTDSSSSGSYMRTNSAESTTLQSRSKKCLCKNIEKKSPKVTKRKCRSFPLTENRIEHSATRNVIENQTTRTANGIESSETETNTYQTNSRKITITIRTKTVPEVIEQPPAIDQYLTNESSEESDTTVSDYATLCSEGDANQLAECEHEPASDSDDNSFFSIKSDIECMSESQYFNCASFTDDLNEHLDDDTEKCEQSEVKQVRKKMVKHNRKNVRMNAINTSSAPIICIEQELCENRIVTSKIEVDKAQIKEFKRRHKQRSQPKLVIDNSFSEEIFNETVNRTAAICYNKDVINEIVESLEAEQQLNETKELKNAQNLKLIGNEFMFGKLDASPKYTGKSINRLLAHRIEQQSVTSVRRTLLQNVAYAITEKEKLQKLERKKMVELAPIKPPRSFTASSSSSPLSKQSFESSATVPISELDRTEPMGFVIPSSKLGESTKYESAVGEATSVRFGWIRPNSTVENDEPPASRYATADQLSSSTHYSSAQNEICAPKENIDTVDSSESNKGFERFSANLSVKKQNNLSTPIRSPSTTQYVSVDDAPANIDSPPPAETLCKTCKCHVKKDKHATLGKTSKRLGKAALKRTKTLIGTSKNFLKKSTAKEDVKKTNSPAKKTSSPAKKTSKNTVQKQTLQRTNSKHSKSENEEYSTPLKEADNTFCNNRDIVTQNKKCLDKSLNLTPKELNQNIVELNPSPKRTAETSNVRLLRDAPLDSDKNDSEYVTPDEAFDFERIVNAPAQDQVKTVKRSPSKMISKIAKSSKRLFHLKSKDKRRSSSDESTHYYKSNDYDEVDNKVLLMGEMLSQMRKQIEDGHGSTSNISEEASERPPSSAKKCLFRDRTISTSSGDLLEQDVVERIATVDLHDEPEPLYAEIEMARPPKGNTTLYNSCIEEDVNEIKRCDSESEPVQLKEVFISGRSNAQPSKYIMVNNNPKILYATVNRNCMQTRSLETIESRTELSEDQLDGDSFQLSSSYESLDMSLINDFATVVQTELDECQFKMNEMFITATSEGTDEVDAPKCDRKSTSGSESIATSDMNSGCSSFYRRSRNIASNRCRKTLSDFVDTLSMDTVATGSYCESLSRGNDLNSEIKDTITSLEYMPSETGDSTDLSHDLANFRSCNVSKDSTKFHSLMRSISNDSSPSSSLYRTFSKIESPSKAMKKMSPSLKALKSKFRNSFRTDFKKPIRSANESFASAAIASDETSEVRSCISTFSGSCADAERKKLFESICSRLESLPDGSVANASQLKYLIDRIRQQQEMRKSIRSALEVCRTNGEFHNSRELVEAEQLMLMSCLKECSALEKLICLWQSNGAMECDSDLGEGNLTIKYLEFELKFDSIFDTHFNYFYVCVCSYRDQVEFSESKERKDNRIVFNNLKMQFSGLSADFEIRVEIYALRLRKNPPTEKGSETFLPQCDTSRYRLQGKTLLTSSNLSRKHVSSSYHSPRKLQHTEDGKYVYTSYGLISPAIILCGQVNTLCDSLKIGYQEQLYFQNSKANGFLNIADAKQKWDRLWCRIDGFAMNFWNYPQDVNDTQQPLLTLKLDQCNFRAKSLLVDREICPRPRTFKIDLVHASDPEKRDRARCIQPYFISAESQLDLELWLNEIQKIFEMIKSWNI